MPTPTKEESLQATIDLIDTINDQFKNYPDIKSAALNLVKQLNQIEADALNGKVNKSHLEQLTIEKKGTAYAGMRKNNPDQFQKELIAVTPDQVLVSLRELKKNLKQFWEDPVKFTITDEERQRRVNPPSFILAGKNNSREGGIDVSNHQLLIGLKVDTSFNEINQQISQERVKNLKQKATTNSTTNIVGSTQNLSQKNQVPSANSALNLAKGVTDAGKTQSSFLVSIIAAFKLLTMATAIAAVNLATLGQAKTTNLTTKFKSFLTELKTGIAEPTVTEQKDSKNTLQR